MKQRIISTAAVAALASLAPAASAAPAIDGTKDAEYGNAVSVQTVQTQFGDNESEWNAAYGRIDAGKLFLMLTGNLQNNFNKLEIFIDSKTGGQSTFDSAGNDNAQTMDGLVFDAGFTADYHLIARRGNSKFDLDFADLGAQSANFYENVFTSADFGAGTTGTGVNTVGIGVAYNGSNTGGVTGGTEAADQNAALAVTTGLELAIDLGDLDWVDGPIQVMVGQNNGGHDFWSNQFLGGLTPPQGNLGGPGAKDFTTLAGNQFFAVEVPEPASMGVLAIAALAGLRRGRRAGR